MLVPRANRAPWPREPLASIAEHAIRGYLRAEDAVYEDVLPRVIRRSAGVGRAGPYADLPMAAS